MMGSATVGGLPHTRSKYEAVRYRRILFRSHASNAVPSGVVPGKGSQLSEGETVVVDPWVSAVVNATKHTLRHAVLHASVIDAATVLLADVWTGVDRAMVRRSPLQSVQRV